MAIGIEKTCREHLLRGARTYAKAHGFKLTTVARKCHGSVDFFDQFARGRVSITLKKYDEILAFLGWPPPLQAKKTAVGKTG